VNPIIVTCLCVGIDFGASKCVCQVGPRCAFHCIERRSRAFRHSTHGRLRPGLPSARLRHTTIEPYFLWTQVANFSRLIPSRMAWSSSCLIILRSAQQIQSLVTYGTPGARRLRTGMESTHRARDYRIHLGYSGLRFFKCKYNSRVNKAIREENLNFYPESNFMNRGSLKINPLFINIAKAKMEGNLNDENLEDMEELFRDKLGHKADLLDFVERLRFPVTQESIDKALVKYRIEHGLFDDYTLNRLLNLNNSKVNSYIRDRLYGHTVTKAQREKLVRRRIIKNDGSFY